MEAVELDVLAEPEEDPPELLTPAVRLLAEELVARLNPAEGDPELPPLDDLAVLVLAEELEVDLEEDELLELDPPPLSPPPPPPPPPPTEAAIPPCPARP